MHACVRMCACKLDLILNHTVAFSVCVCVCACACMHVFMCAYMQMCACECTERMQQNNIKKSHCRLTWSKLTLTLEATVWLTYSCFQRECECVCMCKLDLNLNRTVAFNMYVCVCELNLNLNHTAAFSEGVCACINVCAVCVCMCMHACLHVLTCRCVLESAHALFTHNLQSSNWWITTMLFPVLTQCPDTPCTVTIIIIIYGAPSCKSPEPLQRAKSTYKDIRICFFHKYTSNLKLASKLVLHYTAVF